MTVIKNLFTTLSSWEFQTFNGEDIIDPVKHAYVLHFNGANRGYIMNLQQLYTLLQSPFSSLIQALVCNIEYTHGETPYGIVIEALCDAHKTLPYLKALFIGDIQQHKFRKSKLHIFDIRPILEAFPNLEVLQVRGCMNDYDFDCDSLQHHNLKTLIL
jgi:hypothetical protein